MRSGEAGRGTALLVLNIHDSDYAQEGSYLASRKMIY